MGDVRNERRDGYSVVTLDRSRKRNALDLELAAELSQQLAAAAEDVQNKAVVLTGAGGTFSAGADRAMLSELVTMPAERIARSVYAVFQGLTRTVLDAPVPVVAVVDGPAMGAGCDLALACDCRLVTSRARFEETWVKLGLIPGMGGMALLPPLVGLGRARSMLYRAEPINGLRAVEIGLAEAVLNGENTQADLDAWLQPLLQHDRAALERIKQGTRQVAMRFIADDLNRARSDQALRLSHPDTAALLTSLSRGDDSKSVSGEKQDDLRDAESDSAWAPSRMGAHAAEVLREVLKETDKGGLQ